MNKWRKNDPSQFIAITNSCLPPNHEFQGPQWKLVMWLYFIVFNFIVLYAHLCTVFLISQGVFFYATSKEYSGAKQNRLSCKGNSVLCNKTQGDCSYKRTEKIKLDEHFTGPLTVQGFLLLNWLLIIQSESLALLVNLIVLDSYF